MAISSNKIKARNDLDYWSTCVLPAPQGFWKCMCFCAKS